MKAKTGDSALRFSGQTVFLLIVLIASLVVLVYIANSQRNVLEEQAVAAPSRLGLADIPFNGAAAYEYLKQICAIGPRVSGTEGMLQQQKLVGDQFRQLGGQVSMQTFRVSHPRTGNPVPMANMIVQWHPDRKERILLCAHYDTRPFPDRDPKNKEGIFLGANDGASGVALLMQLGHDMPKLPGKVGVDFVLFDGEELVYKDNVGFGRGGDPYFLGSEFFARDYVENPPAHRYRWGVLLDMVGDKDLQLHYERNSMSWSDTRPLVQNIWATARQLGVTEFVPTQKYEVRDDHLQLKMIGKIPTCDIIDFDYPYWHTQADIPENCSALSLAKVGYVIHEWLKREVLK